MVWLPQEFAIEPIFFQGVFPCPRFTTVIPLLALAKHITTYGLNPAEKFIVIPDDQNQYIVLDGNRRLTALRLLETPSIVEGYVSENLFAQLKKLSASFLKSPVEDAPCIVFQDNEQADPWIELIHDGESGGAGLVKWSAQQRSRYQARKGNKALHLTVLDFVAQHGQLSPETVEKINLGKYPTSTLKRVLSTPYVREKLGIEKKGQMAFTQYPKSDIIKGLSRVIDDTGTGRINANHVRTQTDRINYINSFDNDTLPSEENRNDEAVPIEDAPDNHVPPQRLRPERRASMSRKKLIPGSLRLDIDVPRINDIYHELKRRLIVHETPNAVAVLLRAFLEMSVDEYIDRKGIQIRGRDTLANKVSHVADYMEHNGILAVVSRTLCKRHLHNTISLAGLLEKQPEPQRESRVFGEVIEKEAGTPLTAARRRLQSTRS